MNNEHFSRAQAFRGVTKHFHRHEQARYLIVELVTFGVITAASAVALLGAATLSVTWRPDR